MTSEEVERPRFVTGGYGRHRYQWVNIKWTLDLQPLTLDSLVSTLDKNLHSLPFHRRKSSISNFLTASRKTCWKLFISPSEDKIASLSLKKINLQAAAIIPNNNPSSFNKVCKGRNRDVICRYGNHKSDIQKICHSIPDVMTYKRLRFQYNNSLHIVKIFTEVHTNRINLRK